MKGTLLVAPGVPEAAKEQVSLRSEDAALTVIQSCARRAGLGGGRVGLGSCMLLLSLSGPQFPSL